MATKAGAGKGTATTKTARSAKSKPEPVKRKAAIPQRSRPEKTAATRGKSNSKPSAPASPTGVALAADTHQLAVEQARAEVEQSRAELEQSRAELEQSRAELEQARAEAQRAESAAAAQARAEVERVRTEVEHARAEAQRAQTAALAQAHAEAQRAQTAAVAQARAEAQRAQTAAVEHARAEAQRAQTAAVEHARAEAQRAQTAAVEQANRRTEEQKRRVAELEARLAAGPSHDKPAAPGTLSCPRCGAKMDELQHLGVTIDRCSDCSGLYFDAGELEEVIRREYPERESPPATAAAVEAPADEAVPVALPEEITAKRLLAEGQAAEGGAPQPPAGSAPPKRGFFQSLFSRKPKPPASDS